MTRVLKIEYPNYPYLNLAFEEAIPLAVGKGIVPETLRFWRSANSVVIGRFQCPTLEVDFDKCLKYGVRVVRRFTGGGAVYQDLGNLNFALSLRRDNPLIGERLLRGFELVGKAVEIGLRRMGILDARFKPINSVMIGDKKVAGMAGLIARDFIFVHGSILISSNLKILNQVLRASNEKSRDKFVRSKRQEVTTVKMALKREVTLGDVRRAIIRGLEGILNTEFFKGHLTRYERRLAEMLYREKYSRLEWSLGPCTACPRRKMDEIIFKKLTFKRYDEIHKF